MAAARGPVNSSAARPAWAVQLQYDFHSQKLLSRLANHIAIMLRKAESAVLKTPSILLIPPLIPLLIPLLMLLLIPLLILLLITQYYRCVREG